MAQAYRSALWAAQRAKPGWSSYAQIRSLCEPEGRRAGLVERGDSILGKEACEMTSVRVAAVQASYVLMDQAATLDRVAALTGEAAAQGAQLARWPFPRSSSRARRSGSTPGRSGW